MARPIITLSEFDAYADVRRAAYMDSSLDVQAAVAAKLAITSAQAGQLISTIEKTAKRLRVEPAVRSLVLFQNLGTLRGPDAAEHHGRNMAVNKMIVLFQRGIYLLPPAERHFLIDQYTLAILNKIQGVKDEEDIRIALLGSSNDKKRPISGRDFKISRFIAERLDITEAVAMFERYGFSGQLIVQEKGGDFRSFVDPQASPLQNIATSTSISANTARHIVNICYELGVGFMVQESLRGAMPPPPRIEDSFIAAAALLKKNNYSAAEVTSLLKSEARAAIIEIFAVKGTLEAQPVNDNKRKAAEDLLRSQLISLVVTRVLKPRGTTAG